MHIAKAEKIRVTTRICVSLCSILIFVVFGLWWHRNPCTSWEGRISALISTAMFMLLGIRFLSSWGERWGALPENKVQQVVFNKAERISALKMFLALLLVESLTVSIVYVIQVMNGCREPFRAAVEVWTKVDSQHYLTIAEEWYLSEGDWSRVVQLVFLPGYPMVVRLFKGITGEYFSAGMLVSALSFAGGGTMLYCLARLDVDKEQAVCAVKYCCIWPGAYFFAAPMSESLFFLLSVSCIYCGRTKQWGVAGVLGCMAAFTRSLGILLMIPLCFELMESICRGEQSIRKGILDFLKLLLVPVGFIAYCGICKTVSGEWFKFLEYQQIHWHQSLGLFFNTAAYQIEYAISCFQQKDFETLMGLWGMNLFCIFASLIVMLCSVKRQRLSYTAYYIGYFFVAIGATWLLSAPRYLIVMFPISIGLADLAKKRHWDGIITSALTSVNLLYMIMFVNRWSVW